MRLKGIPLALVALVGGSALAQTGPPPVAPEMAQLDIFVGHVTCTGRLEASDLGPGAATESAVEVRKEAGGAAVSLQYAIHTGPGAPAVSGVGFWTWNPLERKFVGASADTFGLYNETSPGWEGERMVFQGDGIVMGQRVQVRDTFVKESPTDVHHSYEVNRDGRWGTIADETCHKAGATQRGAGPS
jgi:hypothetical protein